LEEDYALTAMIISLVAILRHSFPGAAQLQSQAASTGNTYDLNPAVN
jgi:hypothetical protein